MRSITELSLQGVDDLGIFAWALQLFSALVEVIEVLTELGRDSLLPSIGLPFALALALSVVPESTQIRILE